VLLFFRILSILKKVSGLNTMIKCRVEIGCVAVYVAADLLNFWLKPACGEQVLNF